ncbi:MAG: Hsp20 family protein [Chitinivibrionales bacterium]|nr:Hsp20 family protein [Chitinivibrionales bacterium]
MNNSIGRAESWALARSKDMLRRWEDFEQHIEDLFTDLIDTRWGRHEPESVHPAIDIYETDGSYVLTADLPGVAPEDIHLHVHGNRLTLCGTRYSSATIAHAHTVVTERFVGRFCRRFTLPHRISVDKVERHTEGGVYRAVLPKEERVSDAHVEEQ